MTPTELLSKRMMPTQDRPPLTTSRPGLSTRTTGPRLRELDGLRLLAALMVCLYHYTGRDGPVADAWGGSPRDVFPHLTQIGQYGSLGVQIFFVISGFVICMSSWGRGVGDLFRSRVVRLYPAYWAALFLTAGAAVLVGLDSVPRYGDFLINLTMLQMPTGTPRVLGVCWTLWAELRFYLLFAAFVLWKGATKRRVTLFCGGWTVAAVIAQGAQNDILNTLVVPEGAPYFVIGLALYLIHRFGNDPALWGVVAVNWALGSGFAMQNVPAPSTSAREPLIILAVLTCGIGAMALIATGRLAFARWRWLTVAGALTYPFYLIHEHVGWSAILLLRQHLGLPAAWTLPTAVAVMLGTAWLIHRFVERPLTSYLRAQLRRRR
ncbi:acyltransferase family protein [Streptomyces boninensis]|uniref:acyltransferase family protein n=1 Tax=Streptomyces boninensis TaxID=2039455 RepID=UPI003B21202F